MYASFTTYWISNQVHIEAATSELIQLVSALDSVLILRLENMAYIEEAEQRYSSSKISNTSVEWGVTKIQAPHVWADGITGQGVVVGSIDSGVRSTHQALASNFGREYSWFDPEQRRPEPYDVNGHGTHTMGTIAGSGGIGVAPGATWMTCKGCRTRFCLESELLACGQFMLCPTNPAGTIANCSKVPRVVSNSWVIPQGSTWYSTVINAWSQAGIVAVFAIGNRGPGCGTTLAPGEYPTVLGVGASTKTDTLASFSSKGPSPFGVIKPDIVAPGVSVRSAINTSDTAFGIMSGTSMATPHVAGSIVLLLSAAEPMFFTIRSLNDLLFASAERTILDISTIACNGTKDSTFPNNQWGHGRLNVFRAYQNK